MKRPVYVLCNGEDAFCGHATTPVGAKRVASKYGYKTHGEVRVSSRNRFVITGESFGGRV